MSIFSHKYYHDLDDLPIYNWVRIHETGDHSFLIKKKGWIPYKINDAWRKLLNDFYSKYGIKGDFKDYLKKMRLLTILICDNAIKFDAAKNVKIQLIEKEMQEFTSKTEVIDFWSSVNSLSKFVGYEINPHKMSVAQYYSNIQMMEKSIKQSIKNNGRADKTQ